MYLAYAPTVNITYINHDSIRYFHKFYNKALDRQNSPLFEYSLSEGRFILAEIEQYFYETIQHLTDLARLRFMTIAAAAACAALLAVLAGAAGLETVPAFCLGTTVLTLPGFQDFIFVPYLPCVLAGLISLCAGLILSQTSWGGPRYLLALALVEAAFFTYPPSTFFILVPPCFQVLFQPPEKFVPRAQVKFIVIWILAAALFYLTLKLFFWARIKSTSHDVFFGWPLVFNHLRTLLPQGLPQIISLWNIYGSKPIGLAIDLMLGAFVLSELSMFKSTSILRMFALLSILFILNIMWVVYGDYMPQHFMAAQAVILGMVYKGGQWLAGLWKRENRFKSLIWPACLLGGGLVMANHTTTLNVMNNHAELMFVRSRIAQEVSSQTQEIHIIRKKDMGVGYNGMPTVYDNFNKAINDYEIPDLIRVALTDMGEPFELHCIVTYSNAGDTYSLLPNAVVIDMNDLAYIYPVRR